VKYLPYWFGDANLVRQTSFPGVSVEQEDASRIGIKLGDVLTFSIGGIETKTEVLSIRSLDWRSMRPNFFYILEPGSLELASPTFITSFYLPPEQKSFINDLLKVHPTLMVVELDRVINQIQTIITQVSYGVLLVFILTLCGGILVLFAAVLSSLDSRKREIGLLRAMGASKSVVTKSLGVEFAVLGAIAGALAIIGCEALVFLVQRYILENPVQPHYLFWVAAPCLGAILIASLGYFSLKPLVSTAPAQVLRDAQ
jgi:putative ABC transport system permease protein